MLLLERGKKQLEQKEYDLTTGETRVFEFQDLLPSSRQLKNLGVDVTQIVPWIETIAEKAEAESLISWSLQTRPGVQVVVATEPAQVEGVDETPSTNPTWQRRSIGSCRSIP